MDLAYILSGGAPIIRKFHVGGTVSDIGVPLEAANAGEAGVTPGTTTAVGDMVGCSLDTATHATAQNADGSDPQGVITTIINPDAVWEALLSGGATEGTALDLKTVTTASTDGLAVTTGDDFSSPTYDEGVIWGFSGANAGKVRKITSVSTTAATVTVAFPLDIAVGDEFLVAPFWPGQTTTAQLTTNLYQIDASIAVGTGAALRPVEFKLLDQGEEGRTRSTVLLLSADHVFGLANT